MIEPQDYLDYIVKGLVDNPDDVKVVKTIDEMGVLLTLEVNPEDMGQVIGRQGATAKAMRTLVRVCGMKSQSRVNVKISEPEKDDIDDATDAADASGEPEPESYE
ncbi:MAG: KH domain-containing protein [Candidatus Pacebacteria bacterium]|nr:KH domain-containing protein [Candidatus Paceibacterota bacterium]